MSGIAGRSVVVTRAASAAQALANALRVAGAQPIVYPTIEVRPPSSWRPLDEALRSLGDCDWVVFTSVNGVHFAIQRADELGIARSEWRCVRIAAVGPATAHALAAAGLEVDAVPDDALAVRIPDVLGRIDDARILLLRADLARDTMPHQLRDAGATVHDIEAYCTVPRQAVDPDAPIRLRDADAVTFTSPSTVHGLLNALGIARDSVLDGLRIVTIGPVTSEAARTAGLAVHAEADARSVDGLIDALCRALEAIVPKTGA